MKKPIVIWILVVGVLVLSGCYDPFEVAEEVAYPNVEKIADELDVPNPLESSDESEEGNKITGQAVVQPEETESVAVQYIFSGNPEELVEGVSSVVPEQLYLYSSQIVTNEDRAEMGYHDEGSGRVNGYVLMYLAKNTPDTSWRSVTAHVTVFTNHSEAQDWSAVWEDMPGYNPPTNLPKVGDGFGYSWNEMNSCGGEASAISMVRFNVSVFIQITICENGTSTEDMEALAFSIAEQIDNNILSSVQDQ